MRTWKRIAVFVLFFLTVRGVATVDAQPQSPDGTQQFADFGDFKLRNGSVIHDFRIGYRTLGQLNADKSNAILWPTWLGGTSLDLLQFIGPGNVLDSGKYYVVLGVRPKIDFLRTDPTREVMHIVLSGTVGVV